MNSQPIGLAKIIVGSLLPLVFACSVSAQLDPFLQAASFGPPDPGNSRFFRLGVLAGFSLKSEFSVDPNFNISRSQPGAAGVSGVDHFYDDGYVRVDQTGNAQGYTSFWGYNNSDQVVADTLTLHSATSFAANEGAVSEGEGSAAGVEVVYGGFPWRHENTHIGWELGFGWLPVSIDANHSLAGTVTRTVHRFNTGGIHMPTAPYSGGDSGIGPTIRDVAEAVSDDDTEDASLTGQQTLDTDLFLFRLGPTLHWELGRRTALSVSAGAAVGFLTGSVEYTDTLAVDGGGTALNDGKVNDSDFAFGGYISTTFMYHVEEHGDLYISLQYLPMTPFSIEGGGRRAELDMLGSVFLSAGINWPF